MQTSSSELSYLELISKNQAEINNAVNILKKKGLMFQYIEDEIFNGRNITINNKKLLNFGNCSYLGLEKHPELINSSIDAVKKYGTQTSNSRAAFSIPLYREIEELLPEMFPGHHVITKTVTLGHLSVLPILIQEKDAIILDAYVHNSIRITVQTCKANGSMVIIAKHNDIEHVKYLSKRLQKDGYQKVWYCADAIYSMHGNFINIEGLWNLLNEDKNLFAYIDDAHGTGWYGNKGCGYVFQNVEIHPKMIVIESFAKSMASCGGVIVVKSKELAEIIRLNGQTMIFSGPLQPAVLGATIGSIKVHLSPNLITMQNELLNIIKFFKLRSTELDLNVITNVDSPIQLIKIGDVEKTYRALEKLLENGFFVTAAVYPAVPIDDSGIRISFTRHLLKSDIDNLLVTIKKILDDLDGKKN